MIYFYALIANGTKQIPRSFHNAFTKLQEYNVLETQGNIHKLKSDFIIGSVEVMPNKKVFIKSFRETDSGDLLLERGRHYRFKKGDIVLAQKVKSKKQRRWMKKKAGLIAVLYATKPYTIAVLVMKKGQILALELESRGKKGRYLELKLSQKSLKALPKHCVVKVEVASGNIVEVFGVLEDANIDEKIALSTYNRTYDFSPSSNEFALSFGDEVDRAMYPNRVDLSHLPFCVIDPIDAKDHDDAIYFDVKSRTLYVAIADVSEYVSFNSELDKEAKKRGFSLYFPHKVLPMLPFALSSGICSLKQNELRLAMVWEISLNTKAEVKKSKLFEALIQSHANVSYEEIESFLQNKSAQLPDSITQWLKAYVPFVKKCRKNRLNVGFDFKSEEIKLKLNESMEILSWRQSTQSLAHSIIEESMLLANVESAKMLDSGIFRIHPPPKLERVDELRWDLESMGYEVPRTQDIHTLITQIQAQADKKDKAKISQNNNQRAIIDGLMIKSLSKATYSSKPLAHFGLGFESYTHFTSPIRRYSDLIVHRILKAILHKDKNLPFLLESCNAITHELNLKEKQIAQIESYFYHFKMLRYAKRLLDKGLRCEILVSRDEGEGVALNVIPQVKITLDRFMPRFSVVEVEIMEVDLLTMSVYAKVLDSQTQELMSQNTSQKCGKKSHKGKK
ncbi:ribonuclease R [Helicobacter cinaedi]|uniref:RNB domain-containing ribonuclease n=1 Tax=Helicobacter cinaedi TaxID=213 RepID=UPI001F43E750|nr:ribonuclease R family protein [Helicobacter cinaedi]BDB66240.1 ribonuclease R [Helicobacter cinaedi]